MYLQYLFTNCVSFWLLCVKVIEERLILMSSGGLRYVAEWKNGRIEHKMDHLACFIGTRFVIVTLFCVNSGQCYYWNAHESVAVFLPARLANHPLKKKN